MASEETRNFVTIEPDLCKGCRVCIESCPRHCLALGSRLNKLGYQYARFDSDGCTACGLCFYSCPEPGTIRVFQNEPMETGTL